MAVSVAGPLRVVTEAVVPVAVIVPLAVAVGRAVPPAAVTRCVEERIVTVTRILFPPVLRWLPRRARPGALRQSLPLSAPAPLRRSSAGTWVLAAWSRTTTLTTQTAQAAQPAGVSRRVRRARAVRATAVTPALKTAVDAAIDTAVFSGAASGAVLEAVVGAGTWATAGTVSGGRPAGRLRRRVRGLVCRHRPIIARTKEAHCSPRHKSR